MKEHFDTNTATVEQPKGHPLPYIALGITYLVPFLVGIISDYINVDGAFFIAVIMLSPIAGMLTAIVALCLGKKRIGTSGIIISIFVIAVPLIGLIGMAVLFFALSNGSFVLHM